MTNNIARIENKFALDAHYKMSLVQQKVFYVLISRLNPKEENEFQEQVLTITELKEVLGDGGNEYKGLYSRFDDFIKKTSKVIFRFPTDVKINGKVLRGAMPFFQYIEPKPIEYGEKAIVFKFNNEMKYFLLKLKEYVQVNQLQVAKMRNSYAIRIYIMLKAIRAKRGQYEKTSSVTYEVEQLRNILGIEDQEYKRFFDFERRVLKSTFKEVNKNTDIRILEIEKLKSGRRATALVFHFTEQKVSDTQQLKIELPQPKKDNKKAKDVSIEELEHTHTKAQNLAFEALSELGVNSAFIMTDILAKLSSLGSEIQGYEDVYIKMLLGKFKRKSTEAGKPHQAGVFVNWWKKFLNDEEQQSRFRETVIEKKKQISDLERTARAKANQMTFHEYETLKKEKQKEPQFEREVPQFASKKIEQATVDEMIKEVQSSVKPIFDFENIKVRFPEKYIEISVKVNVEYWQQMLAFQKEVPGYKVNENQAKKDIQKRIEFSLKEWYKSH